MKEAVLALLAQGHSQHWIARNLGIHRTTIRRYQREAARESVPPPTAADGHAAASAGESTGGAPVQSVPPPTTGTERQSDDVRQGPPSLCQPYLDLITAKLELGLSGIRIHDDLSKEKGFTGSYESVKRFVRRLEVVSDLPYRRLEVAPGTEAQVDFGLGAPTDRPGRAARRPQLLRLVLGYSRKGYSQVRWRQSTEDFLAMLEDAFWHLGGVPQLIVVDNLKAAVKKADWYDPDVNPRMREFCRHYGCSVLVLRPGMPRHKGKVERGVGYAQDNALKGRRFVSLVEQNDYLDRWESQTADARIHGTTKEQVRLRFERERPALLPLPAGRFPFFREETRVVHTDGHIEVEKAYYSVPPEYLHRRVRVRWDAHVVRIMNDHPETIRLHPRTEPGRFQTHPDDIHPRKIAQIEQGATKLLRQAQEFGTHCGRWAATRLEDRGVCSIRAIQGLLALKKKHTREQIDEACRKALARGTLQLADVRALIGSPEEQTLLQLTSDHPIIRNPQEYGRLVEVKFDYDGTRIVDHAPSAEPRACEAGDEGCAQ